MGGETSLSGRPITFDDLIGLGRITEAAIASGSGPGSERVIFEVSWHRTADSKIVKELWTIAADGGGEPRPLVRGPHSNGSPRI